MLTDIIPQKDIVMLPYFCLPSHVLTLLRGNSHALHLLSLFCANRSVETNNTKFLSIKKMVKLSGVSQREVYRCIERLTDFGLIEEVKSLKGERMYHLPFLNELESKSDTVDSPSKTVAKTPPGWDDYMQQLAEEEAAENERSLKDQLKEMETDE